jgi:tetratricopeptide (TPR) repeat protein
MNNDSCHLENDIGLPIEDRIDILYQEIELAVRWERPAILFAIYKSDSIRDEVNTILQEKLKAISQKTHSIKTNYPDQFDFLSQISKLPNLSQTVLLIDGFNWECGAEGVRVFTQFNEHREYFIDNNIRAIFWLFENEVSDFATNATECWILRHRVVEFVDIAHQTQRAIESTGPIEMTIEHPPVDEYSSNGPVEQITNVLDSEEENASRAKALMGLGMVFWRKGNLQRALKYLHTAEEISKLLTNHNLEAQCNNALALVHTDLGNLDDAVSAYHCAISLSPESEFLWSNLGKLLSKNEKNEEALIAFKRALSYAPQDFLSWDGVGHIYNKFGVYQNAISAFEKALKIAPYYEYSWEGIGKAYLESGLIEKAKNALNQAVEINTHLIDAWINLGKSFSQEERDLDAMAVFQRALEFNPQNANLWLELGKVQLLKKNFAESITAFQKVLSQKPQCSEAHLRLADALFQIGDYGTSASVYEDCLPLFEDKAARSALWDRLGDSYSHLKDYEKAIAAYKQADLLRKESQNGDEQNAGLVNQPIKPEDMNSESADQDISGLERGEKMIEANHVLDLKTAAEWNEHGHSHLKAGAYNDAIVAYTKAIELAPQTCWPYIHNLAHVHYEKGKARGKNSIGKNEDPDIWEGEEEGESASFLGCETIPSVGQFDSIEEPGLEKNHKIHSIEPSETAPNPGHVDLNSSIPVNCCSQAKEAQVLGPLEEANDELGSTSDLKIDVSQASTNGNEIPSENPIFSQPVEATPQNSMDWNEIGNSYNSSKKFDDAIEAFKKAIEIDRKNGQPYSNLGFTYYRLGQYETAILLYKKSLDFLITSEEKAVSWNRLGDAYRQLGDYWNALAAYQKASELAHALNLGMACASVTLLENSVAG